MKLRTMIVSTALALSLTGCVHYGETGALITPFGVAGIHSFAPRDKVQPMTPDQIKVANEAKEQQQAPERVTMNTAIGSIEDSNAEETQQK
jgi:hypothetical protein